MNVKKIKTVKIQHDVNDVDVGDIIYNDQNGFINAQIRKPLIENIEDVQRIENLLAEIKLAIQ